MMDMMGGRWKDYRVLQGVTGRALAQIIEQTLPCINNNTRIRAPDVTYTWREEARPRQNRTRKLYLEVKIELFLI